jgi:WD40 repeat protein
VNVALVNVAGYLISGSSDNTIKMWSIETGQCINTLEEHTDSVVDLVLYKSDQLISCSSDRSIRI